MTPEQKIGWQFEIFIQELMENLGYYNVLRNVEYHKMVQKNGRKKDIKRQVDLCYQQVIAGSICLTILEAKYSTNGNIRYKLRSQRVKNEEDGVAEITFDNLVDEMYERMEFTGASNGILITNRGFDDSLTKLAPKRGIRLIDGSILNQINGSDIEDRIKGIDLREYNLHKNIIYL